MSLKSAKKVATACMVTSAVFAGTVLLGAGGGGHVATAQRPPSVSPFAVVTRQASQGVQERFKELQANHQTDRLNATQSSATERAAGALFAVTHPQLAKSAALPASDNKAAAQSFGFTDWYRTQWDSAYLGIEWWNDNFTGEWFGYTVTWDPNFGTQYGDQYLYYLGGTYYGYYYWHGRPPGN
jgi:hypothetical protein